MSTSNVVPIVPADATRAHMAWKRNWRRLRDAAAVVGAMAVLGSSGHAAVLWLRARWSPMIVQVAETVFFLALAVWIAVFTRIVLRMQDVQEQALAELKAQMLEESRQHLASLRADIDQRLSESGR